MLFLPEISRLKTGARPLGSSQLRKSNKWCSFLLSALCRALWKHTLTGSAAWLGCGDQRGPHSYPIWQQLHKGLKRKKAKPRSSKPSLRKFSAVPVTNSHCKFNKQYCFQKWYQLQAVEGCTAAGRARTQGHPDTEESLDIAGAPRIRLRSKGLVSGPTIS